MYKKKQKQVADIWLLTVESWYGRWYEYDIIVASCTDSIYDLENEKWLFYNMVDHIEIYGSRVTEGFSTFNVYLVLFYWNQSAGQSSGLVKLTLL